MLLIQFVTDKICYCQNYTVAKRFIFILFDIHTEFLSLVYYSSKISLAECPNTLKVSQIFIFPRVLITIILDYLVKLLRKSL